MAAYRLYTQEVAEGVTDFNDENYHILKTKSFFTDTEYHTVALIFRENDSSFIVANGVEYHEYNSIDWSFGHYFTDIFAAVNDFRYEAEYEDFM